MIVPNVRDAEWQAKLRRFTCLSIARCSKAWRSLKTSDKCRACWALPRLRPETFRLPLLLILIYLLLQLNRMLLHRISPVSDPVDSKYTRPGDVLRNHSFRQIISPSISCKHRDIELIVCVPLTIDNVARRHAIRNTWGNLKRLRHVLDSSDTPLSHQNQTVQQKHSDVHLLFFVGHWPKPDGKEAQQTLLKEAAKYGDIVQESYLDAYANLTLKSIAILKWVVTNCPNAQYVAKVDDDVYFNIPLLLKLLRETSNIILSKLKLAQPESIKPRFPLLESYKNLPPPFIIGDKFVKAKPERDIKSKWFTSPKVYSSEYYPDYVSGTAYAMSGSAVHQLYTTSLRLPLFWMEDIFITGMSARAAGVPVLASKRFTCAKPKGTGFSQPSSDPEATRPELSRTPLIHSEGRANIIAFFTTLGCKENSTIRLRAAPSELTRPQPQWF
ncbi:hexosyltransferase [Plakobranchus ocellatus]|uniref:Hexosyltransferase n=1 Tax=Plakobranchus ocellatus TaxID=259542 RepID=A0AAV4CDX5_9GAST|nr:hexosyltransferase [Plakobranchus ocellatus]